MNEKLGERLHEHRVEALEAIDEYKVAVERLKRRSKRLRENMYNIAALPFISAVVFVETVQPENNFVLGMTGALASYSAIASIIVSDICAERCTEEAARQARYAAGVFDENGITRERWISDALESDPRNKSSYEAV